MKYPCRMTMGALVRFKRASGKDVSQLSGDDVSDLVLLLWCCVCSACSADGVPFALPFDEFADALTPSSLLSFTSMLSSGEKKSRKKV